MTFHSMRSYSNNINTQWRLEIILKLPNGNCSFKIATPDYILRMKACRLPLLHSKSSVIFACHEPVESLIK